jgi:sugar fermentation stimulation protein A
LRYTLEFVEVNNSPVMVNTIRTNKIVEELLLSGKVQLPFQFDQLKREVKFGEEGSKVDFLLRSGETSFFLEVKNVTMTDNMTSALFPDAVTKRGQKHISELLREIEKGSRGGILFAIQRGEVDRFSPADHIDLEYGELLRGGVKNGLEIIPLKIIYDEDLKPIGGEILEFDL